jgi:hypothetical protein
LRFKILFVRRGLAYFVDCLVAFIFFVATQTTIFKLLRDALHIDAGWFKNGIHTELYTLSTISLPIWLYFASFDSSRFKGTLGKLLLRLEVTKNNKRLDFRTAFFRAILKLLPWETAHMANNLPTPLWYVDKPGFRLGWFLVSYLLIVAYADSILVDGNGQSVYDRLLMTRVDDRRVPICPPRFE